MRIQVGAARSDASLRTGMRAQLTIEDNQLPGSRMPDSTACGEFGIVSPVGPMAADR
ncbi:hypothetical protein [Streptomyces sp. NPDC090029]|uniref:hypothetical protein n=1 Tax=Streptomyces sp. NPDC090029 TaxID=3365924 RepID=UPI0037FA78E7